MNREPNRNVFPDVRRGFGPVRCGLLAVPAAVTVLAGCASTATSSTGAGSAPPADAPAAAAAYASGTPPAAARMVCDDEIRGEVAAALGLATVPAPQPAWADHVYTCPYVLPAGPLVLSVTVTPSDAAARAALQTARGGLASPAPEPRLGQQAYGDAAGTVVAVKDTMVLRVDATALPDDVGTAHLSRLALAEEIAAGVLDCWAGD
jgi:hypothetical protein